MQPQAMVQSIRNKLEAWDIEYERIVRERESLQIVLEIYERDIDDGSSVRATPRPPTQQEVLTNAMFEVLSEEQPLHRKEILTRVKAKRVVITAKDALRSITYHLSQDQKFESVGDGAWQLVGYAKSDAPNAAKSEPH